MRGLPDEGAAQAGLLRDVVGPRPWRAVTFNPRWATPDVLSLAQEMYDDRAFDRLPALADALVAAGCDDVGLLDHCRGPGPHARGCWGVDLVLGKE